MSDKTGIALRKFKISTTGKRSRAVAKGDEVTLPAQQFDDFAKIGLVEAKPKKKAKTAKTATPGETTAKGADE